MHGVPKGSVFGPLLFNNYISKFPRLLDKHLDIIMFADDTSMVMSNSDCEKLNINLNSLFLRHLNGFMQIS